MIDYVMIEPTNLCNLNCKFCNRNMVVKSLKSMSLSELSFILNKIKCFDIKNIKLQGLGEVFLNKNFDEMCKIIKEIFSNVYLISSTNCQHDQFLQLENSLNYLDMLYISVDGLKENYESLRMGAKWEKLIEMLKFISTLKNSKKCHINFVASDYNYLDIEGLIDISNKYKIGDIRINIVQNWSQDELQYLGQSYDFMNHLKKFGNFVMGKSNWDFPDCFWPKNGMYIDVFGNVRMCCLNTDGISFGNIFESDIEEIRSSKDFQLIKNSLECNNPTLHCVKCDYKRLSKIIEKIKG